MIRLLSENYHRNNCLCTISIYNNLSNNIYFVFFYFKYPVICSKIFQWPLNYLFGWNLLSLTWLLRQLVTWPSGFALLPPLSGKYCIYLLCLILFKLRLGPRVCVSVPLLSTPPTPLISTCFTSFKEPFIALPRSLSKLLNALRRHLILL